MRLSLLEMYAHVIVGLLLICLISFPPASATLFSRVQPPTSYSQKTAVTSFLDKYANGKFERYNIPIPAPLNESSSYTVYRTAYRARIYASPNGDTNTVICGKSSHPCSLGAALSKAPSGSSIILESGVYKDGPYHITKSLSIVSESSNPEHHAVLDGQDKYQPLWFDNVAAHVSDITFRNGKGHRAGCLLITRANGRGDEVNIIERSRFFNCTSIGGGDHDDHDLRSLGAGGAIGIFYSKTPPEAAVEISHCGFVNNYGRSNTRAAGAVMVRYADNTPQNAQACSVIMISQPGNPVDITTNETVEDGTIFYKLRELSSSGWPIYKTHKSANVITRGSNAHHLYLSYCEGMNWWSLNLAIQGKNAAQVLANGAACKSPIAKLLCSISNSPCDSPTKIDLVYRIDPKTKASEQLSTPTLFICQNLIKKCKLVEVSGAPPPQEYRNGVYELMSITRCGRPCFKHANSDKPQYIRYCCNAKEWIITDDDPNNVPDTVKECSRGVASVESRDMHPVFVKRWRFWETDKWTLAPSPGGLRMSCAASVENGDYCPVISAVSFPMSSIPVQPILEIYPHRMFHNKPLYSCFNDDMKLWYCPLFSEWAVSLDMPPEPREKRCVRAMSSQVTDIVDPAVLEVPWAQFTTIDQHDNDIERNVATKGEWTFVGYPLRFKCSEDCPRIAIEFSYHPTNIYVKGGKKRGSKPVINIPDSFSSLHSGFYEAVGRLPHTQHRIYRQTVPPYNFLYFSRTRKAWELARGDTGAILMRSSNISSGPNEKSPIISTEWKANPDTIGFPRDKNAPNSSILLSPQPRFMCESHVMCSILNISFFWKEKDYTEKDYNLFSHLRHIYCAQSIAIAGRNVFVANLSEAGSEEFTSSYIYVRKDVERRNRGNIKLTAAYLYYCAPERMWMIGPQADGMNCPFWIASAPTSSTHPTVYTTFPNFKFTVSIECTHDPSLPIMAVTDAIDSLTKVNLMPSTTVMPLRESARPSIQSSKKDPYVTVPVSDVITNCLFYDNAAIVDTSEAPVAGAIQIVYGGIRIGSSPLVIFKKVSMRNNEGLTTRLPSRVTVYSAGGFFIINSATFVTPLTLMTDVNFINNTGQTGGVHAEYLSVQGSRILMLRNRGTHFGGGFSGTISNYSFFNTVCRLNHANYAGGCAYIDPLSFLWMQKSELMNNTAGESFGTTLRGGFITFIDGRILGMYQQSLTAHTLVLSSSELLCIKGTTPASIGNGFGCIPDINSPGPVADSLTATYLLDKVKIKGIDREGYDVEDSVLLPSSFFWSLNSFLYRLFTFNVELGDVWALQEYNPFMMINLTTGASLWWWWCGLALHIFIVTTGTGRGIFKKCAAFFIRGKTSLFTYLLSKIGHHTTGTSSQSDNSKRHGRNKR